MVGELLPIGRWESVNNGALVEEQLVEKKRGRGMFVNAGARNLLLQGERQKFLAEEWPRVHATIQRLGLAPQELLVDAAIGGSSSKSRGNAKDHVMH
jgi:hypothetical protein